MWLGVCKGGGNTQETQRKEEEKCSRQRNTGENKTLQGWGCRSGLLGGSLSPCPGASTQACVKHLLFRSLAASLETTVVSEEAETGLEGVGVARRRTVGEIAGRKLRQCPC